MQLGNVADSVPPKILKLGFQFADKQNYLILHYKATKIRPLSQSSKNNTISSVSGSAQF
jgi:hypothetical protein